MPITIQVASHPAHQWTSPKASTPEGLLSSSSEKDALQNHGIIQTSFTASRLEAGHITASENGLVHAAFRAYAGHHHLILRPDDVWASILSQLSFYVNAHAEELRSLFVAHEGRMALEVVESGNVKTVDFGNLAERMTYLIQENVLDPDLRSWIIPNFSTTTANDRVVASVLMMGTLQKYFSYQMSLICGIPTVTLEGERRDWERLLGKLPKLETLGDEPKQFAALLSPVIRHFVASFDNPQSEKVFWERVAHETGGSGPTYLSGWITGFCFWDEDGKSLYGNGPEGPVSLEAFEGHRAGCDVDGVLYHRVDTEKIPAGFASVPVTVDDNGHAFETKMVAGLMGIEASSTGDNLGEADRPELDTIRPATGWFMYRLEVEKQREERKGAIQTLLDEQRLLRESLDQKSTVANQNGIAEKRKRLETLRKIRVVGEELRKLNHDDIVQEGPGV
ncbi:hypothetical protein V5O48_018516 [Marasmius crinis-equi]|uniref:DUF4419 domain-containing protein n=1 Tax=Marasmius crinis-equi TaxID=585013 RepID=A0ABR3EL27_9AGAR